MKKAFAIALVINFFKCIRSLIIFLLIAIPSCHGLVWFERQSFYEGILPEKIEISRPILIADRSFFETCFFAVYRLSDKTVDRINQEGLVFFADATRDRGYYLKENHIDREMVLARKT